MFTLDKQNTFQIKGKKITPNNFAKIIKLDIHL